MNHLAIDFSPRTWRRAVMLTRIHSWLAVVIGFLCCVILAFYAFSEWKLYQARQVTLEGLRTSLALQHRKPPAPKQENISAERANAVNHAISQLNLPWRELLDALETATPKTIALLSLEPDATRRQLKCVAEAKDSDAMIHYMEQLRNSTFFDSAVLLRHEVMEQDPNKPLRFQFEAHWSETRP